MRIAVTGSSGKLGRATCLRLREAGHAVLGLDRAGQPGFDFSMIDFTDYGQTLDGLLGITARHDGLDAIVHLAAIPVNGPVPDATVFHNNMITTFNVMHAALRAGIDNIVYASSITAMGFPFAEPPAYLPLDEDSGGRSNNTYGMVKVMEEAMAGQLVRRRPSLSITALRFTNVTQQGEYQAFADRAGDPAYRRDLMWSYVDARDGAQLIDLALQHAEPGFEVYNVAASDTGLTVPSVDLARQAFPDVLLRKELGEHETLMSIDKAVERLGYRPQHLWRDELAR
ncbi:NAD(P)-dependent oxidoreductase [Microlunatus elymi]|uniref:NAD(P)-dependent oxidoreductase n=1 Tax=Microlunatus elymi TaxID=2596828 RepID=A0A516Q0Z1_9ACTN|nr:NAD(P)-dependent oxidoreductase [Microlunatus elymi]QDP97100.1 NAD(P)-dependent oxidoreductase [Microlunatus elymi]